MESNRSKICFDDVCQWIEDYDGIEGRLRFFQAYMPLLPLWQRVGRPLMSMRTAGLMDVERVAKPIKHMILTKQRNSLEDDRGVVLFRAQQNLKHLMNARLALKGKVHENLLRHAAGVCDGAQVLELQEHWNGRREVQGAGEPM